MRPITASCSCCGVVAVDPDANRRHRGRERRCPLCGTDIDVEVTDATQRRGAA